MMVERTQAVAPARGRYALSLSVNGTLVERSVPANTLLLDFLRDELDLTGAKRSCDVQVCGACTVLVDGAPVSACTYLACEADGRDVLTVEGLADGGELHPVQAALVARSAAQCGFCIPGMVLTAVSLLERVRAPSRRDVVEGLEGNLCRCTGYAQIVDAVLDAAGGPEAAGDAR